jgi:hypothetical protein
VGGKSRERSIEGPDGRAGGGGDDNIVLHFVTPFGIRLDGGGLAYRVTIGSGRAASGAGSAPALRHPWNLGVSLSIGRIAGLFCINSPRG